MTEEENQSLPRPNGSDDHENQLNSQTDHNTIEEVINLGVYGLTGVEDAVSKPNDDSIPSAEVQSVDPQTGNTLNDDNSQITNQTTDSNSEGIAANPDEEENDSIENHNQAQGELESLPNQLTGLLEKNDNQNLSNEEEEEEAEEEEEEEEAEDPNDSNPIQETQETVEDNNKEEEKSNEDKNLDTTQGDSELSNEKDNNKELTIKQPMQEILTAATDVLLQPTEENNMVSNNSENDNLPNLSTDIANSLLPDDNTNNDNEKTDDLNKDDNSSKNEEKEEEIKNENNDENKDENNNDDDNANDDGTDGMSVHDEFKDSYSGWGSPISKVPGSQSVSHLPPLETTPELDSQSQRFLERFEQHGKLPDPDCYSQVLQYIQRQKVNSVVSNDFISAGHYQNISQRFITAINSTHQNENHRKKIDLLEEKLEETNVRVRSFQHETDEIIKQERYRLTDKRAQIVNIHEETLNKFEEQWNDEVFLVKYAKPSSDLLQAKKVERSFVLNKDFEGAENCRKKVAELEKLESHEAQKKARSEMEKQYKKLTSKQDAEIESFDEMAKKQLELVSKDRSNQLEKLVARQSKLQSQLSDLKNPGRQSWTSASGPIRLNVGSRGSSLGTSLPSLDKKSSSQLENLMTPRTIQRYALFKTTIKQPKLTVKPLGSINQKRKQVQAPKF